MCDPTSLLTKVEHFFVYIKPVTDTAQENKVMLIGDESKDGTQPFFVVGLPCQVARHKP